MKFLLVLPCFIYFLFIIHIGLRMFRQRVSAVKGGKLDMQFFKTFQDNDKSIVPDEVQILSRHFDNQFQIPMLFYITVLFALQGNLTHWGMITLAWLFVVTRFFHSYVHLGANHLMTRVKSYFAGAIVLAAMWLLILVGSWPSP